ncbi:hypothetical protein ACFL52_03785 [Candidatus Margulisiibacteriota bacterium]
MNMPKSSNLALTIGAIAVALGVVSRVFMAPVPFITGDVNAQALFVFANTSFLISIVLMMVEKTEKTKA